MRPTPRPNPRTRRIGAAYLSTALALLMSSGATKAQTPTFPSQVEVVTLDVVVIGKDGRPVSDLTRDELVVEEDGQPQEIVSFERIGIEEDGRRSAVVAATPPLIASNATPPPRALATFALIVDDQGLGLRETADTRAALSQFVQGSLRDGDLVTLATTSGTAWWTTSIPQGREDLLAIIGRLQGRAPDAGLEADYLSDYEAFALREQDDAGTLDRVIRRWTATGACFVVQGRQDPGCPSRVRARAGDVDGIRRQRTRVLLATLHRTLDALALGQGRKSVILYSRGFLRDSDPNARELAALAREANAAVYFVDARGLQALGVGLSAADAGPPPEARSAGRMAFEDGVLESGGAQALAEETGGLSFRNSNDLSGAGARVADESRMYYLVGIHPSPGRKPGDWRKLKAIVKRPGVTVRTRKGYRLRAAAAEDTVPRPKASGGTSRKPSAVTTATLDSADTANGIPLRAMAYVFEPGEKKLTRVLVAAEIDPRGLPFEGSGPARAARLELGIAVTERDTGQMQESHEALDVRAPEGNAPGWRSVGREFELPAGVFQARVVVHDPRARAVGAVSYRFLVPSPEVLHLTTPILTDQVDRGKSGDQRPRAAVAIHRAFRAEGNVYCEYEVVGARMDAVQKAPRVSAGVELRRVSGEVVRKGESTPIAPDSRGRIVRLIGLSVSGLPEGDYELVLSLRDEVAGALLERREPFSLLTPE
jgi:VWFA-related protein